MIFFVGFIKSIALKFENVYKKVVERLPFLRFFRWRCPLKAGMTCCLAMLATVVRPVKLSFVSLFHTAW